MDRGGATDEAVGSATTKWATSEARRASPSAQAPATTPYAASVTAGHDLIPSLARVAPIRSGTRRYAESVAPSVVSLSSLWKVVLTTRLESGAVVGGSGTKRCVTSRC